MQGEGVEPCPSFNSYFNNGIADTAARVSREFGGLESSSSSDRDRSPPFDSVNDENFDEVYYNHDDFEFVSLQNTGDHAVFFGGPIGPVFPIFNHDLLQDETDKKTEFGDHDYHASVQSIRIPLEKLIIEDHHRDQAPSSSSSEADELEGIPAGTYCVWTPKSVEVGRGRCKKSKSTGSSSKRWRLLDLLRRSHSDGKDSFVFLTPSSRSSSIKSKELEKAENPKEKKNSGEASKVGAEKLKAKGVTGRKLSSASAHEVFYVRNKLLKEEEKKRSYLPYRQDLVGFWANVNGLGKTFPPF